MEANGRKELCRGFRHALRLIAALFGMGDAAAPQTTGGFALTRSPVRSSRRVAGPLELSMARFLDAGAADFEAHFAALLGAKREAAADVDATVAEIIADVRTRGDDALREYSLRFDRIDLARQTLRVSAGEIDDAVAACPPAALEALHFAHKRIVAHHERQRPQDHAYTDALGVRLGWRWSAIDAVGLYVPGGLASYPSSVSYTHLTLPTILRV